MILLTGGEVDSVLHGVELCVRVKQIRRQNALEHVDHTYEENMLAATGIEISDADSNPSLASHGFRQNQR